VYTRASLTDIIVRKIARRTSQRTSRRGSSCVSGSDKRAALPQLTASYSCGKLNGWHADILATILAKMSVSVSVSVSVPWNSSFSQSGLPTARDYILLILYLFLGRPIISVRTGPIFTKFSRFVDTWIEMTHLTFVWRSLKGRCYGNQVCSKWTKIGFPTFIFFALACTHVDDPLFRSRRF